MTDDEAIALLRAEPNSLNEEYPEEDWPLEPCEIFKQSAHFWEVTSNVGSPERSLKILIDAEKGKLLKGRPLGRVVKGGSIVARLRAY